VEKKALNLRMKKEVWVFLKKLSLKKEKTMNAIIVDTLEKMKNKHEKRLTKGDTTI
jgi:hypothetical protein